VRYYIKLMPFCMTAHQAALHCCLQVLRRCSNLAKLSLAACQLTAMGDEFQDLVGLRCATAPHVTNSLMPQAPYCQCAAHALFSL
jgi:hypothetical protein